MARLQKLLQVASIRYSGATTTNVDDYKVLIIDNVGMLSSLYRYASIVYTGGAFGTGLHNILEPAVFGNPILFGPDYEKFKEAGELISEGGAFSISNFAGLKRRVQFLLVDPFILKIASEVSKTYVHKNTGATDMIMDSIPQLKA
jgi:3-deoxy-D-manno-octulosonic-acid transferase